jgi:adenosylcobinamide kinase/adenosylcobinamide-phosphate guanylyltransferase
MAKIGLVTGGCRSGKSNYAQSLAELLPGPRVYVATCPVIDAEMDRRIAAHKQARLERQWDSIEEPLDLPRAIRLTEGHRVVLVDCLTLWVNNLMYQAQQAGAELGEEVVARQCGRVLAAVGQHGGIVLFVTNEVGMGIVPDNAASRRYRDLVGRCNQTIAAAADAVAFVSCGIPLYLKGSVHELA